MAYKKLKLHIVGVAPLIMHNVRLANPLEPIVKEMKEITAKKNNKTEEDLEKLGDLEWEGGLYTNGDGLLCLPARLIEGMLLEAGKKTRRGPKIKAGVMCEKDALLIHPGPDDTAELMGMSEYRDVRMMTVARQKILRTRPIINDWEADIELLCHSEVISVADVRKVAITGGELCGLGDSRPRYGRFLVS